MDTDKSKDEEIGVLEEELKELRLDKKSYTAILDRRNAVYNELKQEKAAANERVRKLEEELKAEKTKRTQLEESLEMEKEKKELKEKEMEVEKKEIKKLEDELMELNWKTEKSRADYKEGLLEAANDKLARGAELSNDAYLAYLPDSETPGQGE